MNQIKHLMLGNNTQLFCICCKKQFQNNLFSCNFVSFCQDCGPQRELASNGNYANAMVLERNNLKSQIQKLNIYACLFTDKAKKMLVNFETTFKFSQKHIPQLWEFLDSSMNNLRTKLEIYLAQQILTEFKFLEQALKAQLTNSQTLITKTEAFYKLNQEEIKKIKVEYKNPLLINNSETQSSQMQLPQTVITLVFHEDQQQEYLYPIHNKIKYLKQKKQNTLQLQGDISKHIQYIDKVLKKEEEKPQQKVPQESKAQSNCVNPNPSFSNPNSNPFISQPNRLSHPLFSKPNITSLFGNPIPKTPFEQ